MSNVGNFKLDEAKLVNEQDTMNRVINKIQRNIRDIGELMSLITPEEWAGIQRDTIMTEFEKSNASHLTFAKSLREITNHLDKVRNVYSQAEADIQVELDYEGTPVVTQAPASGYTPDAAPTQEGVAASPEVTAPVTPPNKEPAPTVVGTEEENNNATNNTTPGDLVVQKWNKAKESIYEVINGININDLPSDIVGKFVKEQSAVDNFFNNTIPNTVGEIEAFVTPYLEQFKGYLGI